MSNFTYLICPPSYRTISLATLNEKEELISTKKYYIKFPKTVFLFKRKGFFINCYPFFFSGYLHTLINIFPNVYEDGFCLTNYPTRSKEFYCSDKEIVDYFWTSSFVATSNSRYAYLFTRYQLDPNPNWFKYTVCNYEYFVKDFPEEELIRACNEKE